jgi:hypothetical protein
MMFRSVSLKLWSLLPVAAILAVLAGCGGPRFEIVPVSGKAAFSDGAKLPEGTRLFFTPGSGGAGSATGVLGADGSFELVHANGKKGAEVGKYAVEIRPPENAGTDFWTKLPPQYASGSFATVEVSKGMSALDLKLTKEEAM